MSPEQALGDAVDHRSDIFSFGVVLYEIAVTGEMPFRGDSPAEIVAAVLRTWPIPVAELNSALPARVSGVVERALAKDPADRYQSIDDLRADLQEIADNRIPPAPLRVSARVRAAALALTFLVAVPLLLMTTWPAGQPVQVATAAPKGHSIAVLPFKSLVSTERNEALELGMADTLIASLSAIPELDVRPISAVRNYAGLQQHASRPGESSESTQWWTGASRHQASGCVSRCAC